ncbi:acyltransferase [Candidatus Curtissbacteria bacterium]|nr:acyltransferase [Candidatus Curtissbacteria bacterium]
MKNIEKNHSESKSIFYWSALDGLRFFAFLLVFLNHSLVDIETKNPFLDFFLKSYVRNGWIGVDLFFVLSGFLITSILVKERIKFGQFSLRSFWIRRILRIWPLYYLAILVFFFVIPGLTFFFDQLRNQNFILTRNSYLELPFYITFLGNLGTILFGYGTNSINLLWTVSLEQQFYLIFPLFLKFMGRRVQSVLLLVIGIIAISPLVRIVFSFAPAGMYPQLIYVNLFTRMDTLLFGGLLSLLFFYKTRLLSKYKFLSNFLIFVCIVSTFSYFLYRVELFNPAFKRNLAFGYTVIAAFMAYLIYCAMYSEAFGKFLSFKPFVYLGKISYGLYIWQYLAINITLLFLGTKNFSFAVCFWAFVLDVSIASFSYYLFERRFLKIKSRFERIKTKEA